MLKAREQLEAYRRQQKEKLPVDSPPTTDNKVELIEKSFAGSNSAKTGGVGCLPDIDLLDGFPFRHWRQAYQSRPQLTLIVSAVLYLTGQVLFVWAEFGLVFFIFSLLMAIALSLGKRNQDEVSAYSVFNDNCERLLGQMTSEHFERDMLRKRGGGGAGGQ